VDVSGAEGYFGESAERLAALVRLRCVALLGVDLRIGVADSWSLAATASSRVEGPGGVLVVPTGERQRFLAPLPVVPWTASGPSRARSWLAMVCTPWHSW